MSKSLLVNASPLETRVAVIEHDVLRDLHIERTAQRSTRGNIYVGKVARVVPGLEAVFVDIGQPRNGFLHVSDIAGDDGLPREGELLAVQVEKEPLGSKGARLSTALAISSRYLVYLPGGEHIGISKRIDDDAERSRLRSLLDQAVASKQDGAAGGYILRTAAIGANGGELEREVQLLLQLWSDIEHRVSMAASPALVYQEHSLSLRSIRDLARPGLERIIVDDAVACEELRVFCQRSAPELSDLIELDDAAPALFQRYGVETAIEAALQRRLELKSGVHLVFEQTEAMVTVDVNTGGKLGKDSAEETVFTTNVEAAQALAWQLRLRNLGGIIVVDFIDMTDQRHRDQLQQTLREALADDPAKCILGGLNEFGLLTMTRERNRESLEQLLCAPCTYCSGSGWDASVHTKCYEIFREIHRHAGSDEAATLELNASQEVVDCLVGELSEQVAELEHYSGKAIKLSINPRYGREQFDIILL